MRELANIVMITAAVIIAAKLGTATIGEDGTIITITQGGTITILTGIAIIITTIIVTIAELRCPGYSPANVLMRAVKRGRQSHSVTAGPEDERDLVLYPSPARPCTPG